MLMFIYAMVDISVSKNFHNVVWINNFKTTFMFTLTYYILDKLI